jgi:hypothetical protein
LNKQAEEHKLESELLLWNRYQLAFLKDDTDASAIELGQTTSGLTIFPCPTYVRGEAYLMLHDGKAAAADFQKFIDHGGLVTNFPRGRAGMSGTRSRVRHAGRHYQSQIRLLGLPHPLERR